MTSENTSYSSYLESSTCFRYIENDDKVMVRLVLTGLTYNVDELCRAFANKLTEEEKIILNKHRKSNISFEDKKISLKQIESIRESKNTLHSQLIELLIQKYNIDIKETRQSQLNKLSEELKVKIIIYKSNKDIYYQSNDYDYKIYGVLKNHKIWGISDIKHFKSTDEVVYAGEKKKKSPINDIPDTNKHIDMINEPDVEKALIENEKRFLSTPFSIQSVLSFVANDSPSIRAQLNNRDININIDYDKIDEFVFLLRCNNCIWCMKIDVNNSKDFIKRYHYYTQSHKHITKGKPFYYDICRKCKNLHFDGNNHKCNFNQKGVKVKSNDNCYSIYYNELITQ